MLGTRTALPRLLLPLLHLPKLIASVAAAFVVASSLKRRFPFYCPILGQQLANWLTWFDDFEVHKAPIPARAEDGQVQGESVPFKELASLAPKSVQVDGRQRNHQSHGPSAAAATKITDADLLEDEMEGKDPQKILF
jgi:hypothetical protein